MATYNYDQISVTLTHPKSLKNETASGILLNMRGPFGKTRSVERECSIGTIVHHLGPAPRIYIARVHLESATFTGCETLCDGWASLDGAIGTVTITPRNDTSGTTHIRTAYSATTALTNMKFYVDEIPAIVSSNSLCAVEFDVKMKKLTPVGLPS